MIFQEPKMEYVQIDLSIDAQSEQSTGGVETCTGPLAPSNLCNYKNPPEMWLDEHGNDVYPKTAQVNSSKKKSSTTNNGIINGFFDPMDK